MKQKILLLIILTALYCSFEQLARADDTGWLSPSSTVDTKTNLIECAPASVTSSPVSETICEGDEVEFTSEATGFPAPDVEWQVSLNSGSTWNDITYLSGTVFYESVDQDYTTGITTTSLSFYPDKYGDGALFRVVYTNNCEEPAISNPASLTVHSLTWIDCGDHMISQNNDEFSCSASVDMSGKVTAEGNPSPDIIYKIGEEVIPSTYTFPVGYTEVTVDANNMCGILSCKLYVTVFDNEPPEAYCKNITRALDADGQVTITPQDVDDGSGDNCTNNLIMEVSPNTFNCDDIGTQTVTLTVDDGSATNNTDQCTATVTITDNTPPVAKCKPAVAQLDENGSATIVPADVDDGSYDNCSFTLDVSPNTFDCGDLGENTVTLTITEDIEGNSDQCTSTVSVVDNIPPTVKCKNISVYLDLDGTATITAADIDGGSTDNCTIFSRNAGKTHFDCKDLGDNLTADVDVTLTVTDQSGNSASCNAVVTIMQRPTIITYTGDTEEQYSDQVSLSASLEDQLSGTPLSGKTITFEIGSQSTTAVTNGSGIAITSMVLTQNPCDNSNWTVKASFDGECPFLASDDEDPFDYQPEDANLEYTGTAIAATESMSSSDFTVTLRGIITDADDGYPGDVSNAMARFLVEGEPVCDFLPVLLLNSGDPSIGMIEFDWADVLTDNPTTYDVQVELKGCYYEGTSLNYPLTVYNAAGDFITGGGFMFMTGNAAGIYKPDEESKLNFGFNVKFNKTGKNLQGKMNIIFRRTEIDGIHTYQIMSNATTSLGTNLINADELIAEFVSKANLTDFTNPTLPEEPIGNLTLHVTMTDRGEPGDNDAIAFTLYDGTPDALLFSSNWDVTHTREQGIDNGNLVIHSGAAFAPPPPDPEEVESIPKGNGKGHNKEAFIDADQNSEIKTSVLNVYPNPFSDKVRFEFVSPVVTHAQIDIFDMTGCKVKTVFEGPVKGGVTYSAYFKPETEISGMYLYRMTLGDAVYNGKVVYKNRD